MYVVCTCQRYEALQQVGIGCHKNDMMYSDIKSEVWRDGKRYVQ